MFSQNVLIVRVLESQAINYILFGSILSRQIPQELWLLERLLSIICHFDHILRYGDSG